MKKGPKKLTDPFCGCEKVEKTFCCILKDSELTAFESYAKF